MSEILKAAILTAPIILTGWCAIRRCPEARTRISGIATCLRRCPEARIYVTEIGMFLTATTSYTVIAFSLVTHESPNWLPALAILSISTLGISLSLLMGRRVERRLRASHEHQDDRQ